VIREGELRPSAGLTIIVVIIITVTVAPPRSMRTSMQLLSPVWEDYTPPPFCGNRLDDDDPIISSFAPRTTTTTEKEDEEKTTCSSNDTTTAEQSNKIDATIVGAVIALFVIIREKLLQWSKPKVRPISRDVRTRKPVKIVSRQRTPKKAAAAAGRNNNNNRRSRKPANRRHRWTVRSMNPLRVLAKIPEAYVNMMNGLGRSPAFSSPGMTTFHVVSHNHFPPDRTRDHDLDDFSSRAYYYTSDESIAEILHLDSRRSTSNSKPVDHSDYADAMHQYYYHYRSSSISPGPGSSASALDSNAPRGMNIHNFRRSNSTTKFRDRCDLQFLNS
jgi:hypothetical protein